MQPTTSRRFGVTVLIVALASPLAVAAGYAQTQGMGAGRIAERTEATRDTRQEGRRNARDVKPRHQDERLTAAGQSNNTCTAMIFTIVAIGKLIRNRRPAIRRRRGGPPETPKRPET